MAITRLRCWLGLIALLLVCSCALTGARRDISAELLAKDYAGMSDKELQTYYYQLSDQIAKVQRASRSKGNAALPEDRRAPSVPTETDQLRERWNMVRTELRTRGVLQ